LSKTKDRSIHNVLKSVVSPLTN